ncbi:hypothetical protein BGW39_000822 [Mortierella sp. 14UC]|nr:hypothetical protein BGW39_000822 [Mortierella sp. 14UC]
MLEAITAINYDSVFAKAFSLQRINIIVNNASSIFKPNMASNDPASDLFNDFFTKYYFYCPLKYFSREISKTGGKVYQFRCRRYPFARQTIDRWTTFAKTGDPNSSSGLVGIENSNPDVTGINWPAYDGSSNSMLELGVESKVSTNADQAACAFLDNVLQYDFMFRVIDDEQEENVQAIRSVNRNIPPTEVLPARPDEIYYVDCQVDPETQREFILWDDILQAFEDGVHVRNKARIVPFLKGPDFRVLEPRRIAPVRNTVLDVIVSEQEEDDREEGEKLTNDVIVSRDAISTVRRNPVYGLEEEAMDNYSHIDRPVNSKIPSSNNIPQVFVQALSLEEEERESRTKDGTTIENITTSFTARRNPAYGLEEAAMDNYSHMDPAEAEGIWMSNISKVSIPVLALEKESNEANQEAAVSSTPRRNPAYGLVEAAMENYSHIDRPAETSSRGPQTFPAPQSPSNEDTSTFQDTNAHSVGPQEYPSANGSDLVQTIINASRGNKDAQVSLGDMYKDGRGVRRDYLTAMDWYQQAAGQGDAVGKLKVGALYEQGLGFKQDYAVAMDWYLKAAEQGNTEAQCSIGTLYENGHGVLKDFTQAMAWYLKAAEQGLARAQCNVGVLFERGQGVSQDYSQALVWYLKAAEQGHPRAQCNSGELYETGEGVPVDYSKALEWYRRAAEQGLLKAKKRFEDLEKKIHDF